MIFVAVFLYVYADIMARRGQSSRGGGHGDMPWLAFQQITSKSSKTRALKQVGSAATERNSLAHCSGLGMDG